MNSNEESWLVFASLTGVGFSLIRTENPITLLLFITLFLGLSKLDYKRRIKYILPMLLCATFFESILLFIDSPYLENMVSTTMVAGFVAVLLLYGVFLILSRWSVIEKYLMPKLHMIFALAVLLIVIVLSFIYPHIILASISTFFKLMMNDGGWDATWLVILPALLFFGYLLPITKKQNEISFLRLAIPIYFFTIIITALNNNIPYTKLVWYSSPNRIFTQILPLGLMLLALAISNLRIQLNDTKSDEVIRVKTSS
jgi:hypothetical protein